MKYIRTKDGRIAKIEDNMLVKNNTRLVYKDKPYIAVLNGDDEIIAQADTIEELCDEFRELFPKYKGNEIVGYEPEKWVYSVSDKRFYNDIAEWRSIKDFIIGGNTVYGAIWVEIKLPNGKPVWRLEPVAIMNDKGELELI